MKKLFIYIFLLVLISTSAFAEKIKWTKCKIIEDPLLDSFVKVIQDEEFFKSWNLLCSDPGSFNDDADSGRR